jgi:hypothetical protein
MTNDILRQIADTIVADLKALISDRKFAPRVWTGATDHVRIYTGSRDEHIKVYLTRTERSQSRMSWGAQIDEVLSEAHAQQSLAQYDRTVS